MFRANSVGVMIARLFLRMIGFILMIMIGAVQAVGTIITAISAVILKGISALMIFTTILLYVLDSGTPCSCSIWVVRCTGKTHGFDGYINECFENRLCCICINIEYPCIRRARSWMRELCLNCWKCMMLKKR